MFESCWAHHSTHLPARLRRAGVVPQLAGGHDTKGAHGRKRPRLGAPQDVFVVAVSDDLAVRATGQFEVAQEHLPEIVGGPTVSVSGVEVAGIEVHELPPISP